MSSHVDDETYRKMSEAAYLDLKKGETLEDLPGWEVAEDFKSYSRSGFDAVTFIHKGSGEAVIAYRGTEGSASAQHLVPDLIQDGVIGAGEIGSRIEAANPLNGPINSFKEFTGLDHIDHLKDNVVKFVDKNVNVLPESNQFYQAEDYAKEMKNKYGDYHFTLTGHSLGGGNAQYAAAYTGMNAVTFSAPSVVPNLTGDMRSKAENGHFDGQIINYVHPGDVVGSGALGGYDRHVGSTYYIDSSYEAANDGVSLIDKAKNSFSGPNYHQLDRYQFDENGTLANQIFDPVTGEEVSPPRLAPGGSIFDRLADTAHSLGGSLSALAGLAGGSLAGLAAGARAGSIQVTPAELRSVAERWNSNALQCQHELQGIRQRMNRYMFTSHSTRLTPIVQQLDQSVVSMSQWHVQHTGDIVSYIKHKADMFEQTDRSG
ncbi:hypothetical protein E6C60_3004 [Paenibacillus algicola]|uniref:Uncharacterized protein n=1 Tax=Paenibacillus algicola TaxID=2565926 RepID=A0A4P8XN69_9BACL|nr:DUF2974 domain-containing protein [Paenibacillus algicola]QCT03715.1 hypothetical protein E6C60_3004 [Paenibacillus algicola]